MTNPISEMTMRISKQRFERYSDRHAGIPWSTVLARLEASPTAIASIIKMEETGGEPDVIGQDPVTGEILFGDCSAESPAGRRSLCYDPESLAARKENKPAGSVVGMAAEMGIELMSESQYRNLQSLGAFDLKTSSWILTPEDVRSLGGALFCDRRYGKVFVYHNGAQSYYASRGFRGILRV